MKIKLKQELHSLTQAALERHAHAIVVLPHGIVWPDLPYTQTIQRQFQRQRSKDAERVTCEVAGRIGTRVSAARIKADITPFDLLTLARKLAAPLFEQDLANIVIACPSLEAKLAARVIEALVAALLAAAHALPNHKSKSGTQHTLREIVIHHPHAVDLARTVAEADGNNLARSLTALPPNELTPGSYRKRIAQLARRQHWKMKVMDVRALKRAKAGAFLAVAQGSPEDDACIVHLRYEPKARTNQPAVALVGKGICFDTGGMNLKPARHMHGMHEDMAGSAVALGTLLALTELKVDFPVECWLALAQNHIGPNAYKQNDVVKAANGVSIEVTHTDAEGRMVLADTLHFATQEKPGLLIDYATLTGSCIQALGNNYSGAFSNRSALNEVAIAAGRDSGERVWPFPTDSDYDSLLDSNVADIKQCTLDNDADHILAARFLARFVAHDTPWLHIDLSAINHKGGLAHVPTDITGFGVRFTLNLLLDKNTVETVRNTTN